MQTLFVDRKNSEIDIDRGRLKIRIEGARSLFSVPTSVVELLVISAPVNFSSTLMNRISEEGITAIFINPRNSEASVMTHSMFHNSGDRRLLQYQAATCPELCLVYSREIVRAKLRAQQLVLTKALRRRPDSRYPLTTGISRISDMIIRTEQAESIEALRGMEGAGAAFYFEAYRQIFPPALAFNGRNRRPPRDPVNVILSLSFTMLHAEAVRVLFSTGFDPLLGIYHSPLFGRESLACDLVEVFRPLAEYWIWRMFAREVLRVDHFSVSDNDDDRPCMLGKAGRAVYYANYEFMARRWRRLMRRIARLWLKRLQADFSVDKARD